MDQMGRQQDSFRLCADYILELHLLQSVQLIQLEIQVLPEPPSALIRVHKAASLWIAPVLIPAK